jgi:hypothetical protein
MINIKLLASQAHLINRHKSTRSKLQEFCANIYFNKKKFSQENSTELRKHKNWQLPIANTSPAIYKLIDNKLMC